MAVGVSYFWTPGGSANDSIIISPANTVNYIVHIIKADGCERYDTTTIAVNVLPPVNAGSDQSICIGSNALLSASGGNSYLWLGTGLTSSSISISPASTQSYVVMATDMNGCRNNDTLIITVNPLNKINIPPHQCG